MRRPVQGVVNVVRFNWHFYMLAVVVIAGAILLLCISSGPPDVLAWAVIVATSFPMLCSLLVSWYIYDHSGFYVLQWLDRLKINGQSRVINIHAGFDETSSQVKLRFNPGTLHVLDFYDPLRHTEASVSRARKAYPPFPGTVAVTTDNWSSGLEEADFILLIFAAHEIRDRNERVMFLRSAAQLLSADGRIVVTEHLRDLNNFLAYNLGFFHFYSPGSWTADFKSAGLKQHELIRHNPWVTTFILTKI